MPQAEGKTFGAKQVATRIGTDAKTFRKFLRSPASPVSAVGQGKAYEIPESDLPKIAKAFNKWKNNGAAKKKNGPAEKAEPVADEVETAQANDVDAEPSPEDLAEIELEGEGENG
jgi:hypothetical protein